MKLAYRTRGSASPQGKPRVYFTGHPADLPACSEEIFEDILKTQNCAIYYDEEPQAPYDTEGLLRELEQMQLIVIPVTARFLYQPNRAREVEFPLAMERHIPVLPLMQEQGLEPVFNEKCGDLQVLNKGDPDPTALPFAEKLEKFLASVLVGDELAEKVRAAFDAYVFLSYRKKDRKYAQELVRLIHRNDFCRDIAIWYDEFLTPGENFNEAIADAMAKCQLFTLAVTPNVVEPGNYVMRLEYPEAKKSGKLILPVEMVPTNHFALRRRFRGLPKCTNALDEPALSAALLEAVQKLAIRENDGSPEHNFFIGLAYLNGIDVEVDRERALSLITGAAESGLPEAMEKLVSMYRSGGGVERDYRTAIRWQETLADWRRVRFEEHGTEQTGLDWVSALCDLGDYQKELAALSAAKQAYEQMLNVCGRLASSCGGVETRKYGSLSYEKLGDISKAEGDLGAAKDAYLQSLELRRRLKDEIGTLESCRELSISYSRMGDISRAEGDMAAAKRYYLQDLELSRRLSEEAGTVRARRDLSVSCDKLGDISRAQGDLAAAKDYYRQAFALNRQLNEETGTIESRRDLSISCSKLGDISRAEGDLAAAKDYYRQDLELSRQLSEETGTVQARRDLSISCDRLGDICETEGDLSAAKDYYLQGLELRRRLNEETGTIESRRDLSVSCNSLGSICMAQGDLAAAKGYYLQDLELSRRLNEEVCTVQSQDDLAYSYYYAGVVSDAETKKIMLAKAYDIWNELSIKYPDMPRCAQNRDFVRQQLEQSEVET